MGVTGTQDVGRCHVRAGCFLAIANPFQPRFERGAGYGPFQFAAEEFLHGLALQRSARDDLIADSGCLG